MPATETSAITHHRVSTNGTVLHMATCQLPAATARTCIT
jgi:hypothetical protein